MYESDQEADTFTFFRELPDRSSVDIGILHSQATKQRHT